MQRLSTQSLVMSKLARVSAALGYDDPAYNTVGSLHLYGAYGSTSVVRVGNESGGSEQLSGLGTKKECALFLDGMLAGLRLAADRNTQKEEIK